MDLRIVYGHSYRVFPTFHMKNLIVFCLLAWWVSREYDNDLHTSNTSNLLYLQKLACDLEVFYAKNLSKWYVLYMILVNKNE